MAVRTTDCNILLWKLFAALTVVVVDMMHRHNANAMEQINKVE